MLALMTMVLCAGIQTPDPASTEKEPPKAVEAAAPATPEFKSLSDDEAKVAVKEFQTATRQKGASLATRTAAVKALGAGSHEKLVKPLAKVITTDPALSVQREAAQALGHQPAKPARASILKLLGDKRVDNRVELIADLVASLDTAGYTSKDWKTLERMFAVDYSESRRRLQKAIILVAKNHEEVNAIRLLLENIDEPGATNVNSASNPPAEYWEARWKAWQSWRDDVKDALFAITGQRFNTSDEASAWLSKNRDKLRRRR